MTTTEQKLFAAHQVYPNLEWCPHLDGRVFKLIRVPSDLYPEYGREFTPENNAEQRWDLLMWVVKHKDFSIIKKQGVGYWAHDNEISYICGPLSTETLIEAVCVLGGFYKLVT